MRVLCSVLFFSFFITPLAQAEDSPAFTAVKDMFAGFSAYDYDAVRALGTEDYHLLEVGEIWDMDKLVAAIKGAEGSIERRNYFALIEERRHGDTVWLSYWNRADLKADNGDEIALKWLESAVVIKQDGKWVVEMLHSTRLSPKQDFPKDAVFIEHVGENAFQLP